MAHDTGNGDLVAAAQRASARLADAERLAAAARADYHHAIRQLHLAGTPLRQVADALGISHQRVQQIVQAGGGTWWSRVWQTRRRRGEMACSFCGRSSEVVSKLIAGPRVYICDACTTAAERVLGGASRHHVKQPGDARLERVPAARRVRCSFCGKKHAADLPMAASGDARVCEKCLATCRGILDARGS